MTLTELRYIVALAQEGNFSRAAESCSVSQPTLSVAIARLEDEFGVQLFERGKGFVSPSTVGVRVVEQAQVALREAEKVRQVAMRGRDQLDGPLRLGVIHTIGPYLLPQLIHALKGVAPSMPLAIEGEVHDGIGRPQGRLGCRAAGPLAEALEFDRAQ